MTGREIFQIWAPQGARWTAWVRPVPFVGMEMAQVGPAHSFTIPKVVYINEYEADTAILLDLPGPKGIEEGLALARLGFRPIPLYNGTDPQQGAMGLVETCSVKSALQWGAPVLGDLPLANTAAPVFLLDSNRMHGYKMHVSVFDNSWDIYGQDMPSPEYFVENGIQKIIVRGEKLQRDIVKLLYPFQKKGITIFFTDGYGAPKKKHLKRRPGETK